MTDPTEYEVDAMDHGGRMGGEYLQSISKYDLSSMTQEEWQTFIRCVIGGYFESMAEKNEIPY